MRTIYTPSTIDEVTEAKLWQDAVIVFDTSALLDFYYMTPANQDVMSDVLSPPKASNASNRRVWSAVGSKGRLRRTACMKLPPAIPYTFFMANILKAA